MLPAHRVLVVEDEVLIGVELRQGLTRMGLRAEGPITSGRLALEAVRAGPPISFSWTSIPTALHRHRVERDAAIARESVLHDVAMRDPVTQQWNRREIQGDFAEMPALALTMAQARRL